jgi:hypothetical protein
MKIKNYFLLIILFILSNNAGSNELTNNVLVSIDNTIVTELDLNKEVIFSKFITKSSSNSNTSLLRNESLYGLINRKIKIIETNNYNIDVTTKEIELSLYNYLSNQKITIEELNKFFKENEIEGDYLKNIIITDIKWSKLITGLYSNRMNINLTEINKELLKESQNSSDNEKLKTELIISEKNILFNKFSSSHLEKVKKKYLIKLL